MITTLNKANIKIMWWCQQKDGLKIHLNIYLIQAFLISNNIKINETPRIIWPILAIPEIKADTTFKLKITVSTDDHDINYVMLKRNDFFIQNMRYFFEKGCFRFKNLSCKEAILKTLSY